jgi:hypothetical protein
MSALGQKQTSAPHSISSSASTSNLFGTAIPSHLAVFRLMTSSNLVGRMTGRSAGLGLSECGRRRCPLGDSRLQSGLRSSSGRQPRQIRAIRRSPGIELRMASVASCLRRLLKNGSAPTLIGGAVSVIIPSKMRRAAIQFPQSDFQRCR